METETETGIPAFLLRNEDNTLLDVKPPAQFKLPRVSSVSDTLPEYPKPAVQAAEETYARCDVLSDEFEDRRKKKSYGRLAKMKAKQSDKAAARAGKTWDPNKAEWV